MQGMEEAKLTTLAQIKAFLDGTSEIAFRISKEERNPFIERVFKRSGLTGCIRIVRRSGRCQRRVSHQCVGLRNADAVRCDLREDQRGLFATVPACVGP